MKDMELQSINLLQMPVVMEEKEEMKSNGKKENLFIFESISWSRKDQ